MLAVAIQHISFDSRNFVVRGTITASGNYPTGGDTLNFATATAPLGVAGIKSSSAPTSLSVWSQPAAGSAPSTMYNYRGLIGTNQTNCALQTLSGSGAEIAAGAYPAGVTGDTIFFEALFPKV